MARPCTSPRPCAPYRWVVSTGAESVFALLAQSLTCDHAQFPRPVYSVIVLVNPMLQLWHNFVELECAERGSPTHEVDPNSRCARQFRAFVTQAVEAVSTCLQQSDASGRWECIFNAHRSPGGVVLTRVMYNEFLHRWWHLTGNHIQWTLIVRAQRFCSDPQGTAARIAAHTRLGDAIQSESHVHSAPAAGGITCEDVAWASQRAWVDDSALGSAWQRGIRFLRKGIVDLSRQTGDVGFYCDWVEHSTNERGRPRHSE